MTALRRVRVLSDMRGRDRARVPARVPAGVGFRGLAVGLALLVVGAFVLTGCSSNGPASSSSTSTSTRGSGYTPLHATAPVGPIPTAHPRAGSTTSTTSPNNPRNLYATDAVKQALVAAYVAHNGLPAAEVAGTSSNTVFYAYVPTTGTYWAIAGFVPAAHASTQTLVAMQDEGCCGVFTMTAGGAWTYVAGYLGEPCPGQIPAELELLWRLTYPPDCSASSSPTSSTATTAG